MKRLCMCCAELQRMYETIRRNLAKRKAAEPWSLETTTMYALGEESVAELGRTVTRWRSRKAAQPTLGFCSTIGKPAT